MRCAGRRRPACRNWGRRICIDAAGARVDPRRRERLRGQDTQRRLGHGRDQQAGDGHGEGARRPGWSLILIGGTVSISSSSTCAEHFRQFGPNSLKATRVDGVKASPHDGTPRSRAASPSSGRCRGRAFFSEAVRPCPAWAAAAPAAGAGAGTGVGDTSMTVESA